MKKTIPWFLIGLAIISVGIIAWYGFNNKIKGVENKAFEEIVSENEGQYTLKNDDESQKIKVRAEHQVYNQIHAMANTLIIADEIWDKEEITEETINALIIEITASAFLDKQILLNILSEWKAGDFSNGVSAHNYVWEKLDGTVGRATGLRKEF